MSGGGAGGGIGSALGTALGVVLAPETGGASLLIPAALGAVGGAAGAAVTGGNPLTAGLEGGAGGLTGGFLSGLLGGGADVAGDAAGEAEAADLPAEDLGSTAGASLDVPMTDTSNLLSSLPSGQSIANPSGSLDSLLSSQSPESGLSGLSLPQEALQSTPVSSSPLAASSDNLSNLVTSEPAGGSVALPTSPNAQPQSSSGGSWLSNLFGSSSPSTSANNVSGVAKAADSGSGIGNYITNHPLQTAGLGLGVLGALMPSGSNPVNVGGNAASVNATNPGFSASLPKYNYNSVQTPYTGNWYTYGLRPQTPQVTNTLTPAARGGLMRSYDKGGKVDNNSSSQKNSPFNNLTISDIIRALPPGVLNGQQQEPPQQNMQRMPVTPMYGGYARGGRVRALAMGGLPIQAPMMPAQAGQMSAPRAADPQQNPAATNPLQAAAQFQAGKKIGQALRGHIQKQGVFSANGMVKGPGKGQDDVVPAKLSAGEYVHSADVVSALGDGSSEAGARELKKLDMAVRAHKTSHGKHFPPKAKSPLAYIGRH